VGNYADVCIFNPETVADTADFSAPISPAAGIELVLVNGTPVWTKGAVAGGRNGKVLLRHELQAEATATG